MNILNPIDRLRYIREMLLQKLPRDMLGDEIYAHALFVVSQGRPPSNEMLFNDYLYRVKVSGQLCDPLKVITTDKYHAKSIIAQAVGNRFVVPTIALLASERQVDEYQFPGLVCVKPTHMSGKVAFTTADGGIDRAELKQWLKENYYFYSRTQQYNTLVPRIIVEPMLFGNPNVIDYKIFCFMGIPKLIQADFDRRENHTRLYLDTDWVDTGIRLQYPHYEGRVPEPVNLAEMLHIARVLAAPFEFVRIDLFWQGAEIYVGEITHCHGGGCEGFPTPDDELRMSKIIFG